MPHIQEVVHIDRTPQEAFDYVTDPANQTTIQSNLIEFEADGPRLEKGSNASGVIRVAGRRIEWTSEVTEYHPGERLEMRSVRSPMEFHITWQFEPEADGCRITFTNEVGSLGSFFGKLADPIVTKMYSRDMRSNLENLKVLLEEA